ncbi:TPA: hypothetical protein ACOEEO_001716 [Enterobacter asburiae]|jgi:hypothetical protein
MKHLPLKAVMTGLEIIETDEGYELHSPAGEAKYDAWGARREVNGIPEYFPSSISMKKRVPAATDVKKTENITLSGAAMDVLYALFFRGALQSGDLPAKSGAAELRELGFAESRYTATKYHEKNFFTFLTAEGQEFAIMHLVNTNFGVPAGGYIDGSVKMHFGRIETDPRKGYAINVGISPEIKTSVKLSPEMEKAISDVVSAELKKNLKPGGTVWEWLRRGF